MSGIFSILVLTILLSTVTSRLPPTWECFKYWKIVPDVISDFPLSWADVDYNGKKVYGGNVLTPTETKDEPKVMYETEPGQFYTVAMLDPDFPNVKNPTIRSFKNWLVVNVPGTKLKAGDVLAEYIGPGPIQGSGFYRYVIVVYKQPKKIDFKMPKVNNTSYEHRLHYDINKCVRKYKLGVPIAGNFFRAEWDEYATEQQKKFGVICKDDVCEPIEEEEGEEGE